jgi:eukaryotic-like serine/threonine-protein kinase
MVGGDSQDPRNPSADPLIGRTLNGRFSIIEPLGVGGMGKVYRALQAPLERVVALKVLNPSLATSRDPGFQKRFLREASLTSKLRHPNTVTVIDYGQTDDGIFYIAMEYLEGRTLGQVLQQQGALPWGRALSVTQQICRSLREAHNLGVVHRDLKPANIILLNEADQDLVKVLDFGLVKSIAPASEGPVGPEVTQNGTFLGSPQYMAPEQARNVADARSDVYSLGVVLYQMLMGRPPFVSKDHIELIFAHYKEAPPFFSALRPDLAIPQEIEALVRRCLEKDPARRFQTMDEVLEGLRVANMAAGGHSGIFKQSVSSSGQYSQPTSGQYNSPTGSGQFGSPTGSGQYASPSSSGQHSQPMFASAAGGGSDLAVDINVDDEARARKRKVIAGAVVGLCVLLGFGAVLVLGGSKEPEERKPNLTQVAGAGEVTVEGEGGPTRVASAVEPGADPSKGPPVRFRLMSQPSGARVYYRGRERGTTPFVLEIPASDEGSVTAELTFAMDGYQAETVITGGSGEVVLMQKLQKRPPTPTVSTRSYGGGRVEQAVASSAPAAVVPASASSAPAPAPAAVAAPATPAPDTASLVAAGIGSLSSSGSAQKAPTGDVILPFGEGMSPPQILQEGKPVQYTREAIAAKIEGTMIVKCTITVKGRVENCRVIKGLPHMEKVVVESLKSRVYAPITFQGRPVAVDFTYNMRLVPPRR